MEAETLHQSAVPDGSMICCASTATHEFQRGRVGGDSPGTQECLRKVGTRLKDGGSETAEGGRSRTMQESSGLRVVFKQKNAG